MTIDELRERIKDEVVLHEGDVAEWEWRQIGLTAEAERLGLSAADFSRLVNQVSYSVAPDFGRISELKARIEEQARRQNKKLSEHDLQEIVDEADRVHLSRSFVVEKWIPAILSAIPDAPPITNIPSAGTPVSSISPGPSTAKPETPVSNPVVGSPVTVQQTDGTPSANAPIATNEQLRQRIHRVLSRYKSHITAQNLEVLFEAIDYDDEKLAGEVLTYLSANFFASENPPRGNTLKEKLLSTDWRHLAWWEEKQQQATVNITTPPVPPAPVQPPPVAKQPTPVFPPPQANPSEPAQSAPQRSSGLPDWALIVLAVVGAVGLLWLVLRAVGGGGNEQADNRPIETQTERRSSQEANNTERSADPVIMEPRANPRGRGRKYELAVTKTYFHNEPDESTRRKAFLNIWNKAVLTAEDDRNGFIYVEYTNEKGQTSKGWLLKRDLKRLPAEDVATDDKSSDNGGEAAASNKQTSGRESKKRYDELLNEVGQYGERRASLNGQWGLWRNNNWMIPPQYEDITLFRNGRATVILNGQTFDINREGEQIRD